MGVCSDGACPALGDRELRGFRLCTPHYLEALEHSAHIVSTPLGILQRKMAAAEAERIRPFKETIARRQREKMEREAATGRPADFAEPNLLSGQTSSQTIAMGDPPQSRPLSGKASSPEIPG